MVLTANLHAASAPTPLPSDRLLSEGELSDIEARARTLAQPSFIHVSSVIALARDDVPTLLAEIRRLRARWPEP